MAGMSGAGKIVVGVAVAVSVGLIGIAVLVDLDTGDRVASIVGAVVGLAVAAYTFAGSSSGTGAELRLRVKRGGTVIDGDVSGSAVGHGSKVVGPRRAPAAGTRRRRRRSSDVQAGRESKVVLGDVQDSAIGDESERQ
ncbi:hypothetical protein ACFV9D_22645 [Streptomyces sp. NPDC059875]|uniref:hypothetical protein n=1 Tax=unclassified Streptomyces TaxID=2593676 RepID=UPI003653B016